MLLIILITFMVLSFIVSSILKRKFKKYGQLGLSSDMSGAEIAASMLRENGIHNVNITCYPGKLTDHYNPANRTVNLSEEVYHGRNAAAAAVASHECGHAVQHARAYAPLKLRSALVPLQNVSAQIMNMVFMAMFFGAIFLQGIISFEIAILVIIACYSVFTLFAFVTLPVEFDASRRALAWIRSSRIANSKEQDMAKDALRWAAMTYVVAALGSLATLLYYVWLFLGSRE